MEKIKTWEWRIHNPAPFNSRREHYCYCLRRCWRCWLGCSICVTALCRSRSKLMASFGLIKLAGVSWPKVSSRKARRLWREFIRAMCWLQLTPQAIITKTPKKLLKPATSSSCWITSKIKSAKPIHSAITSCAKTIRAKRRSSKALPTLIIYKSVISI